MQPIKHLDDAARERVRRSIRERTREKSNGCIEWTGAIDRHGYGRLTVTVDGASRETGPHRAAWLADRGDLNDGEVLDHVECQNRKCCNTDHLEVVTSPENSSRGAALRTTCRRGHEISEGNTHTFQRGKYTVRSCRPCRREWLSQRKAA